MVPTLPTAQQPLQTRQFKFWTKKMLASRSQVIRPPEIPSLNEDPCPELTESGLTPLPETSQEMCKTGQEMCSLRTSMNAFGILPHFD